MADHSETKASSVSSVGSNRIVAMRLSIAAWIFLVVILLGLSFWGGVLYSNEVRHSSNYSVLSASNNAHRRYAVGLVVFISSRSVTISSEAANFNQTFAITAKTLISINGVKATASQIQPGNIVLIQEDKYNSANDSVILVNSHFSG